MSANRRRLENTVPVGAFSPWLIIAILVLMGGMTWVYYKNQIVNRGGEIKAMENELAALGRKNEALTWRIAQLSGCAALQKRLDEGFIKMVKIAPASIVHVDFPHPAGVIGSEIRTVSNSVARR
jgi:hypothetical protein